MWEVITTDSFDSWFDALEDSDRISVIAGMLLLEEKGPHLSRPYADTCTTLACEYERIKGAK